MIDLLLLWSFRFNFAFGGGSDLGNQVVVCKITKVVHATKGLAFDTLI